MNSVKCKRHFEILKSFFCCPARRIKKKEEKGQKSQREKVERRDKLRVALTRISCSSLTFHQSNRSLSLSLSSISPILAGLTRTATDDDHFGSVGQTASHKPESACLFSFLFFRIYTWRTIKEARLIFFCFFETFSCLYYNFTSGALCCVESNRTWWR